MFEVSTFTAQPGDPGRPDDSDGQGDSGRPVESLEAAICELAGHLTAATCRFLVLLGEFDAREGWSSWDMPSCAAWLSWKCQMGSSTAREHVRVARALRGLPVIRAGFAAGRLSYSKVRALTRIADPGSDADLAEMAAPMTANQLDRFARAHRTVTDADGAGTRLRRRLTWRYEDDGSLVLTARLPPEDGAAVLTALRAVLQDTTDSDGHEHGHGHEDGDGDSAGGAPAEAGTGDAPAEAGTGGAPVDARGAPAEAETGGAPAEARGGGAPAEAGTVGGAERLLATSASLADMISLCRYHHTLIHQHGYHIAVRAPGVFVFLRPDGKPIPPSPPLPTPTGQITDTHDAEITPGTIVPYWYGERLDLGYAISVLFGNQHARQRREQKQATAAA